jgi:hypothetical protein
MKIFLIQIPPIQHSPTAAKDIVITAEQVKEYLSDSNHRIRLDDAVTEEIRRVQYLTGDEYFPMQTMDVTPTEFAERLKRYDNTVSNLLIMVALLGKWGTTEHRTILEKVFSRMGDSDTGGNGKVVWLGLRWYPMLYISHVRRGAGCAFRPEFQ